MKVPNPSVRILHLPVRLFLCGLAALALLAGLAGTASATKLDANSPGDVDQVISEVSGLHSGIQSYTFNLHLHIVVHTFPWAKFRLSGAGAYQEDGPYVVDIQNMPPFARGYGHVSLASLDPKSWSQSYTMSVAQRSGDTVVLLLHDRHKSPLIDARATLDTKSGLRSIVWRYTYGGVVALTIAPNTAVGHGLPATLDANISMPLYHASAHADFVDYHVVTKDASAASQPSPPADDSEPTGASSASTT